jgi:rhamnosyl/mannosyltransferase
METVLHDLCEGFKLSDHKTRVICSSESKDYQYDKDKNLEIYRYKVLTTIASQPITPMLLLSFYRHVMWADIIHIHSPNPLIEMLALLIPKSKKVVCTHHSDIHRQKILKFFYLPIWNLFKKKIDRFIVPTTNHIKYSDMISDMSSKTNIIPFGIREEKYDKQEQLNLKSIHGEYVLFVGRLVGYKGINYLIEAMKTTDKKLFIIGRGPERENLLSLVKQTGQENKIFILSNIDSQEALNAYYKDAYCFVLPSISKNENFGIVQLEAMKFSLPIIVTNIKSGVPVVGSPGKSTILIEPENSDEIGSALNTLFKNQALAKSLGNEGKRLFNEKYTYQTMIDSHLNTFEKVLGEG